MCKAIDDIRTEGFEEGIMGLIRGFKSANLSFEQTVEAVIKQFNLTRLIASEKMDLYWWSRLRIPTPYTAHCVKNRACHNSWQGKR